MTMVQIRSVEEPFRSDRSLAALAVRLLSRAEFLGCLPATPVESLSVETIRAVSERMTSADLPAGPTDLPAGRFSHAEWEATLEKMNDQLEMSPVPSGEWRPVLDTLGEDLLAQLLGVSLSSIRRYSAGGRSTPQAVAERLHFVALVLADLSGSYNDYGIRRWFGRPRTALGGRRPADVLGAGFDPDGPDARAVAALAARLLGAGAAA